jgi:hypothetical protein
MTRFNFKKWNIKKLLKHNKESIKAVVVLLAGYNYLAGFNWKSLSIGVGALIGKMCIDSIDYYFSE